MTDKELLSAIASMMNKNNKAIICRIDTVEQNLQAEIEKTNQKIDTVEQNLQAEIEKTNQKIDAVEQNLQAEIEKTNQRVDMVEKNLEAQIEKTNQKIDIVEKNLENQIHKINLKLENDMEPRLRHIEECYISTYDRYKVELERLDKMQMDIEVTQDVIREHGQVLKVLTA